MKIGVVTFWHGNDNYGMILQCWALQQYLKKMGHDPYIIRYVMKGCLLKRLAKFLIFSIKYLIDSSYRHHIKITNKLNAANAIHYPERDFEGFRKEHLKLSNRVYHYIEQLRIFPPKADCYICGSDQIWNGNLNSRNLAGFYLQFGPSNVKRIAYAPSFGITKHEGKQLNILKKYLSKFDAVSCREWAGIEMCKKVGVEAEKVEDPTLLLSADDYLDIASERLYENYIYIYSLNIENPDDIFFDHLRAICKDKKIVVTPASGFIPGREIFGDRVIYKYAKPSEWLSLICYSDLVVTSSFHGVVFSLIFNKKFAYVPLKGEYASTNNRVIDMLHNVTMDDYIISKGSDYDLIFNKVNLGNEIVDKKKMLFEKSADYLNTALQMRR